MTQIQSSAQNGKNLIPYSYYVVLQGAYHICVVICAFVTLGLGYKDIQAWDVTLFWGTLLFVGAIVFDILSAFVHGRLRQVLKTVAAFLLTGVVGIFGIISALGFIFASVGAWSGVLALQHCIIASVSYALGFLLIRAQYYGTYSLK